MTPAIKQAEKARIAFAVHSYNHDPRAESFGEEAADKLGLAQEQVFKTLLAKLDGKQLAVAVVPVNKKLDLKALATVLKAKKADMAPPAEAERATGYIVGGISPLGQKKRLPLVLDNSAQGFATIYVSAGRRGLEIELAGADLLTLSQGQWGDIAR
ncbi:Cys-tRNA(Pro) deacylase [Pokkaliibacter sp. MBI-7]|uniref:Cys-tRNA(Pro) deacylase n=1 Tax=Pokkaliibacter sp. MBI-7 TaxID=3040600 RepID=UPI00244B882D|nr:Cys-tRNA(Pro) deacylase [Pokkaliibacter sp. MBI-7]MDH2433158.1 Cys-tRNA(Pro) deacylase [Pokkaliibacter sp. MBI-7]